MPEPRVAVIAALPREVKALVGHVRPEAALLPRGIHLYRLEHAIVVTGGMGASRVTLALEAARAASTALQTVFSIGLAGACQPEVLPGSVVQPATIVDTRTGERFATHAASGVVLASTETIASVSEKARLASTYQAALVDMEAATLARLTEGHGLRLGAIKGISDAHDFELETLARFAGHHGQFRTAAFAMHTALRPGRWRLAAELGRNSQRALTAMTGVVLTQIDLAR